MYTDQFLTVSTDQTLTSGETVIVSTDTVDLRNIRDMGEGKTLYAVVNVTEAPAVLVTGATASNTGDTINKTGHGLAAGTAVRFPTATPACNLDANTTYYVRSGATLLADSFTVSTSLGGSLHPITADASTVTYIAGPGAVYVQAITASNAALNADVQVLAQSDAVDSFIMQDTVGQKQGYQFVVKLSPLVSGNLFASASQGNTGQRYIGLRYVAGAGVHSGHKVTGFFVTEIQDGRKAYTSGFTVV